MVPLSAHWRTGLRQGLLALSLGSLPAGAHCADIWGETGLAALCADFPVAERESLHTILGEARDVLTGKEGIDPAHIRRADPKGLTPILRRAAAQGLGPLELFSDPQFAAGGSCILLLDEAALAAIDRDYDLHGLWMVRAPLAGEPDAHLAMRYMLLGQGRIIVGYPRKATVKVADYAVFTGQYDYQPYMAMDIVNTPERRALVRLRTLDGPSGSFQPFVGPLGAAIRELELAGDAIVVRYRAWGIGDREMNVRRVPISPR